jgi:hypothetical protein
MLGQGISGYDRLDQYSQVSSGCQYQAGYFCLCQVKSDHLKLCHVSSSYVRLSRGNSSYILLVQVW